MFASEQYLFASNKYILHQKKSIFIHKTNISLHLTNIFSRIRLLHSSNDKEPWIPKYWDIHPCPWLYQHHRHYHYHHHESQHDCLFNIITSYHMLRRFGHCVRPCRGKLLWCLFPSATMPPRFLSSCKSLIIVITIAIIMIIEIIVITL